MFWYFLKFTDKTQNKAHKMGPGSQIKGLAYIRIPKEKRCPNAIKTIFLFYQLFYVIHLIFFKEGITGLGKGSWFNFTFTHPITDTGYRYIT